MHKTFEATDQRGAEEGAYVAALVLHFVGQRLEQGALPCAWRAQQESHAAGLDCTADVVKKRELVLGVLEQAGHTQQALQAGENPL